MHIPWKTVGKDILHGLDAGAPFEPHIAAAAAMIHAVQSAAKQSGPDKKASVEAGFKALLADRLLKLSPDEQVKLLAAFGKWNDVYVAAQNIIAEEAQLRADLDAALKATA